MLAPECKLEDALPGLLAIASEVKSFDAAPNWLPGLSPDLLRYLCPALPALRRLTSRQRGKHTNSLHKFHTNNAIRLISPKSEMRTSRCKWVVTPGRERGRTSVLCGFTRELVAETGTTDSESG